MLNKKRLNQLAQTIAAEWQVGGLTGEGNLYFDFAVELLMRYEATIMAKLRSIEADSGGTIVVTQFTDHSGTVSLDGDGVLFHFKSRDQLLDTKWETNDK